MSTNGLVFAGLIFAMAFGVPAYLMWWEARQATKRADEKIAAIMAKRAARAPRGWEYAETDTPQ